MAGLLRHRREAVWTCERPSYLISGPSPLVDSRLTQIQRIGRDSLKSLNPYCRMRENESDGASNGM